MWKKALHCAIIGRIVIMRADMFSRTTWCRHTSTIISVTFHYSRCRLLIFLILLRWWRAFWWSSRTICFIIRVQILQTIICTSWISTTGITKFIFDTRLGKVDCFWWIIGRIWCDLVRLSISQVEWSCCNDSCGNL